VSVFAEVLVAHNRLLLAAIALGDDANVATR
jgi:hypothetical protein